MSILLQIALVLAIALFMVPLSHKLRLPTVLGYLLTGLIIGSSALALISAPEVMQTFIQISLLALMFWIGLQLRPQRILQLGQPLWFMAILQVLSTALILSLLAWFFLDQHLVSSIVIGLAGSLSAMTLVTQFLNNQQQLGTSYGQSAYANTLIHALIAIPIIAAIPLFAGVSSTEHGIAYFAAMMATFTGLFLCNRYFMQPLYRWIAKSGRHELHSIVTIVIFLGLLVLMDTLGLNLYLAALFSGMLLADSDFRISIEKSLQPFSGLLIGLAFISLGMSLQFADVLTQPVLIIAGTLSLILIKFAITLGLARYYQYSWRNSTLLAASVAQSGEFAFLALIIALSQQIVTPALLSPLMWMASLSMLLTPAFYWLLHNQILPRLDRQNHLAATFDIESLPPNTAPILLIGFGRFGQIIARILLQQQQKFSVMDSNIEATELLTSYGITFYQANATEPEALAQAHLDTVQHVIVAIDDIEDSLLTIRHLRLNYPDMSLWVRARDRHHVHLLQELGVERIWRETYASALELSQCLLVQLSGLSEEQAQQKIHEFHTHDQKLLNRQFHPDTESPFNFAGSRNTLAELEHLLAQDQLKKAPEQDTDTQQDNNASGIDAIRDDLA
ncbi:cation:proton antiporter domain-containing protein [Acinetobacter variabilis]|uniref:cation:proton antiporter domain-containing protein n=1 Tax=Acinetobacter variabilis TaxID=70346 RepID=UPI0028A70FFD|nr:cation:proton antiporter [Acinetobacter variabilis]